MTASLAPLVLQDATAPAVCDPWSSLLRSWGPWEREAGWSPAHPWAGVGRGVLSLIDRTRPSALGRRRIPWRKKTGTDAKRRGG